ILDLDYILEWMNEPDGYKFKIVPAVLKFVGVSDLRLSLDYATPTAALGPFSIHSIHRHTESREHYVAALWRIAFNWPKGEITFEAKGYEQNATAAAVVSDSQCLRPAERNHHAYPALRANRRKRTTSGSLVVSLLGRGSSAALSGQMR